ncbi:hypothetical protein [Actinocorallia populi]|uniref:hypothetical protein n=1 Tax=Actinocorallia populi TaxID=2079200 RepID=UPI000D08BF45|nr:hypothetical protein [Actinocorallia populi]
MRIKWAAAAGVLVLGSLGAATPVRGPEPKLEYEASGCPVKPYEGLSGFSGQAPASAYAREFVRGGADYALLCRGMGFGKPSWLEPLRITRGVKELQRVMVALPRAREGGFSTSMGCPPVNLVLHYPDGKRTVMSFECNRDEVGTHNTIRGGGSRLTYEFARLWRAEHATSDPSRIEPAACLPSVPGRSGLRSVHPAPEIVREGGYFTSDEPRLPSPLAVVNACRYTADGGGRLILREHKATRTGLESLRAAVNAVKPKRLRPLCGGYGGRKSTSVDTLHLTDVTGRSAHLYIARKPCEADKSLLTGISPVAPEISAMLSLLLD